MDCHGRGVDYPSQDSLDGAPRHISLLEFLQADRLTAELVVMKIIRAEDLVDCAKENISDALAIVRALR